IMLFCVPNETYPNGPTPELIAQNKHEDKWMLFIEYCEMDAKGCLEIQLKYEEIMGEYAPELPENEEAFELDTFIMNQNGWGVDVPLVEKMKRRSWANGIISQRIFVNETGEQLNFNSHVQLKDFLRKRGIPDKEMKSLDKYHLPILLAKIDKRIGV